MDNAPKKPIVRRKKRTPRKTTPIVQKEIPVEDKTIIETPQEGLMQVIEVETPQENPFEDATVRYEGRDQRRNSLNDRVNHLNATQSVWKYAIAETFIDPMVPQDSVAMLIQDRFELVEAKEATRILEQELRGNLKLMRVAKGQSDAYQLEAFKKATRTMETPEGSDTVKVTENTTKRKLIQISQGG